MVHHKYYINALTGLHLTLASLLLFKPAALLDQSAILLLGEAMGMPPVPKSLYSSAGFIGIVFFVLAVNDMLVQTQRSEEFKRQFWRLQSPFRAVFFMLFTAWLYLTRPSRNLWFTNEYDLKNRLVFTWSFLELIGWYFIFGELRDEGKRLSMQKRNEEFLD